jgi:2-dehydropantoate 2-reductase
MGFAAQVREQNPQADIYCGTTTEGAYRISQREVRHAGKGRTRVGQPGRMLPPDWFTRWSRAVPGSQWDPDIERALWLKLAINCVINPLTAIYRCPNGELLRNPDLEIEVQRLCGEIEQVSRAMGRVDVADCLRKSVAQVIRDTAANRSSMLQDVLAGRQTEIEYISAYLVELALGYGIPVPHHSATLNKVRALAPKS